MLGETLSHYEIVEKIGEGGMGEVYRAHDTKLGREVAIKLLPAEFSQDKDRLLRFEREAKLLAALNHPCIATLYGFEESEGTPFLVMELVEGETLAERIARGALRIDEALPLFRQIAEGLESAHEKGVIHRDLKPPNIKITPDGHIKILDFGLAKAFEEPNAQVAASHSPTLTRGTALGAIMGTAAYMSPEQAKGKTVDKRTDIWAFGCVVYEVLTGKKVFEGETVSETIAAVIRADPDWSALPSATPSSIRELLRRCLEKDGQVRLRDIGEARIAIDEKPRVRAEIEKTASASGLRAAPWILALGLGIAAAVLGWRLLRDADSAAVTRFGVLVPEAQTLSAEQKIVMALSPDARHLVYVARTGLRRQLYLHSLARMETTSLPGTEFASDPFFSPDGRWVGFLSEGKLKKISIDGGAPIVLSDARASRGATWGPDGYVYFTPQYGSQILRVSANGGEPEPVTTLATEEQEKSHRWPQALPDGKTLLFTVAIGVNRSAYEDSNIDVLSLDTGDRRTLVEGAAMARYVSSGHLVFAREGSLFAAPFDLDRLELTGDTVSVVEGVGREPESGVAHFGLSSDGTLAYVPEEALSDALELAWLDRSGLRTSILAPARNYGTVKISPDGRRVALSIEEQAWVYDLARNTLTRASFGGGALYPIWTPGGERITFLGTDAGDLGLRWKRPDGSEANEQLAPATTLLLPSSWSPDGRVLVFTNLMAGDFASADIGLLRLEHSGDASSAGKLEPYLATSASESHAAFHPLVGEWIAFASDESGRSEIYVQAFPEAGERHQISADGGVQPVWRRDGKELFFLSNDGLWVVDVETEPRFVVGAPRLLFPIGLVQVDPFDADYDVSPDGERFLVKTKRADAPPVQIHVVMNWFEELERLAPTR